MASSSVLNAESQFEAQLWSAPSLDGRTPPAQRQWRTVSELEAIDQQTWEQARIEGHAAGLAAGHAAAQQQIDAQLQHIEGQTRMLNAALDSLARPLRELDGEVQSQLVELSVAIARQLLRRELKLDPSQIIAVVRETVALLPAAARNVRVVLHPDDATLLRERLATPQADGAWTIQEDPVMARGDCRVLTESALIDARIETRLAAVISALLGDERATDRGDAAAEEGV